MARIGAPVMTARLVLVCFADETLVAIALRDGIAVVGGHCSSLAALASGDWRTLFPENASGLQPETDPTSDLFCLWNPIALLNQSKTSRKVIVDRKRKQLPNAW